MINAKIALILCPFNLIAGLWLFSASFSTQEMRVDVDEYNQSKQAEVLVPIPEPFQSGSRYLGLMMAASSIGLAYLGANGLRNPPTKTMKNTKRRASDSVPDRSARSFRNEVAPEDSFSASEDELNFPADTQVQETTFTKKKFSPREQDDTAELRKVFLSYPAWIIYGPMGGGKTSKGGWVAAEHLKRGDKVMYINPMVPYKFFEGLEIYGRSQNAYIDVTQGITKFIDEAERRLTMRRTRIYDPFAEDEHWFLLCDEMTSWEASIDQELMYRFMQTCTEKIRQANMSALLIAHGKTIGCLGGTRANAGKADVIARQFKMMQCVPQEDASVEGGLRCAGHAYVEWYENNEIRSKRITIPKAMQPPNRQKTETLTWYDFTPLIPKNEEEPELTTIKSMPLEWTDRTKSLNDNGLGLSHSQN